MHLWSLAERLCEELAVRAWRRLVAVAPNEEHLHRRRLPRHGAQSLSQEAREGHNRAEEDHGRDLFGDDVHERGIKSDARTLAETAKDHVLPAKAIGLELGLHSLDQRPGQHLDVVEHVKVLILERLAVAHVPGAICDFRRVDLKLQQTFASWMLGPGERGEPGLAEDASNILQCNAFGLRVVPDPQDQGLRLPLAQLQRGRQWALGGRSRHALVGEEQLQPVFLQLLALVLLALRSCLRALGRTTPLRFFHGFWVVLQLFLEGREDQDHLRAVRRIGRPREGVADGILANLVQDRVEAEPVGTHQLRDVLHDIHHLPGVGIERVHPASDVEANEAATPGREEGRSDLDGLGDAVAVDNHLGILVTRLQAVDQLLGGIARCDAIQGKLRKHSLVAVTPAQQGHCVWENLLCPHGQ
mmetsp:Transcript_57045/g.102557  ORF Transcript_57045/g.102557 Transcript_57045/m.102557 type:complete len:415 (+) Transcript_57045:139-1383(+)